MNILSIQSWVAYGHVGNASAVFPLQRLGAEVHAIHTVQFSNPTGYGDWTGDVFGGDQVRALVDGIVRRGALARCDAILPGYMGDVGVPLDRRSDKWIRCSKRQISKHFTVNGMRGQR